MDPLDHQGDKSVALMRLGTNIGIQYDLPHAMAERTNITNCGSAIYTLPMEVMTLIFQQYVFSRPEHQQKRTLALSHTSSHFRAVALGTPLLWCHIVHSVEREEDLFRTAACLHRSKASPLRIELYLSSLHKSRLSAVLDMIIPHVDR